MSVKVEKIVEPLKLGEGPHWDAQQQALFFVDIVKGGIHKYVPSTGQHTQTKLGKYTASNKTVYYPKNHIYINSKFYFTNFNPFFHEIKLFLNKL